MTQVTPCRPGWTLVRCSSRTCDVPGGRVLFTMKGDLIVKTGRSGVLVALKALGGVCRCGHPWQDPDLPPTERIDDMVRLLSEEVMR